MQIPDNENTTDNAMSRPVTWAIFVLVVVAITCAIAVGAKVFGLADVSGNWIFAWEAIGILALGIVWRSAKTRHP